MQKTELPLAPANAFPAMIVCFAIRNNRAAAETPRYHKRKKQLFRTAAILPENCRPPFRLTAITSRAIPPPVGPNESRPDQPQRCRRGTPYTSGLRNLTETVRRTARSAAGMNRKRAEYHRKDRNRKWSHSYTKGHCNNHNSHSTEHRKCHWQTLLSERAARHKMPDPNCCPAKPQPPGWKNHWSSRQHWQSGHRPVPAASIENNALQLAGGFHLRYRSEKNAKPE